MDKRAKKYLEDLDRQYIFEVKKFLDALQKDASPKELITIRKNVKQIFDEIMKKNNKKNTSID